LVAPFAFFGANFALMLGIIAAAYVPFYLVMLAIESSLGVNLQDRGAALTTLLFQLAFIVLWASIAFPIASGAASYAIIERYLGKDVTIGESLRQGLNRFWTLSMAQITATIRVLAVLILLIVPGSCGPFPIP
jgi:hypothetical protein